MRRLPVSALLTLTILTLAIAARPAPAQPLAQPETFQLRRGQERTYHEGRIRLLRVDPNNLDDRLDDTALVQVILPGMAPQAVAMGELSTQLIGPLEITAESVVASGRGEGAIRLAVRRAGTQSSRYPIAAPLPSDPRDPLDPRPLVTPEDLPYGEREAEPRRATVRTLSRGDHIALDGATVRVIRIDARDPADNTDDDAEVQVLIPGVRAETLILREYQAESVGPVVVSVESIDPNSRRPGEGRARLRVTWPAGGVDRAWFDEGYRPGGRERGRGDTMQFGVQVVRLTPEGARRLRSQAGGGNDLTRASLDPRWIDRLVADDEAQVARLSSRRASPGAPAVFRFSRAELGGMLEGALVRLTPGRRDGGEIVFERLQTVIEQDGRQQTKTIYDSGAPYGRPFVAGHFGAGNATLLLLITPGR